MALNVALQIYHGTKANLASLASTGKVGVLVLTTDTQELYSDSGSGTGIGPGNAWLRFAPNNKVFLDANQAARLAESTALIGDISVQADTGVTYVLQALPASTNGNWVAIATQSAPVTSVFGRTGAVVAQANDYAFNQISGVLSQAQLPASIGAGSNLTVIDCGTF
jgi:hypothetical protein